MSDGFKLIDNDDRIAIGGTMLSLANDFTSELFEFLNNQFLSKGQSNWFEDIKTYRYQVEGKFPYDHPQDLRFLLNEASRGDSRISDLIPGFDPRWKNQAIELRKKYNLLFHQQLPPTLESLRFISGYVADLSNQSGFELASFARATYARVMKIIAGEFHPETKQVFPETEAERQLEEVILEYDKRPPLGEKWTDSIPERVLKLNKQTRDLVDKYGNSVKHELGDFGDHVIKTWLSYYNASGEIFVAGDGAVMAFRQGIPTMIGWFGKRVGEDSDEVKGFVANHEYKLTDQDIVEISTNKTLGGNVVEYPHELVSDLRNKELSDDEILYITDYGDLFVQTEEGKPKKLANVTKDNWFTGHLPE
jgi:hypothetical protein